MNFEPQITQINTRLEEKGREGGKKRGEKMRLSTKGKLRRWVEVVGIAVCLSGFLVMFTTFMWIYLAGVSCPFEPFVTINDYNEADFEFLLLLFFLPIAVFVSWRGVRKVAKEARGVAKGKVLRRRRR